MYMFHCVCPRKSAPHTQFHILRGVQPCTASTAEGFFSDSVLRHLIKVVADVIDHIPRLLKESHAARCIARVMEGHFQVIVSALVQFKFTVLDEVGSEFDNVHHLRSFCTFELCAGYGRNRYIQKIRRTVPCVHVLVEHSPHMAALSADYPLYAKAFCFGIDF